MTALAPEDLASPVMSSSQLRDFANRVFYNTMVRISGDGVWEESILEHEVTDENGTNRFNLTMQVDYDDKETTYLVSISSMQPFGADWDDKSVKQLLGGSAEWCAEEDDNTSVVDKENAQEAADEDDTDFETGPRGYISLDYNYQFTVPILKRKVDASRSTSFCIFDEDRDPIDSELIHDSALLGLGEDLLDMERLVRFGELLMVQREREAELGEVTLWDLNLILGVMKKMKFVKTTCEPLSSKAIANSVSSKSE